MSHSARKFFNSRINLNDMEFLQKDYEIPKGKSSYLKLEQGTTTFRILTQPILGWEDWDNDKPIRFRMDEKPEPINPQKPVKHFWAMIVWNYNLEQLQVFSPTQVSIQRAIKAYNDSDKWGDPLDYDIEITREGEDMSTKYTIMPNPKEKISQVIKDTLTNTPFDLDLHFEGKYPFEVEEIEKKIDDLQEKSDDLPF